MGTLKSNKLRNLRNHQKNKETVRDPMTEACTNLVADIILRALRDCFDTSKAEHIVRGDAKRWLMSEDIGYGSAHWYAHLAGLDEVLQIARECVHIGVRPHGLTRAECDRGRGARKFVLKGMEDSDVS